VHGAQSAAIAQIDGSIATRWSLHTARAARQVTATTDDLCDRRACELLLADPRPTRRASAKHGLRVLPSCVFVALPRQQPKFRAIAAALDGHPEPAVGCVQRLVKTIARVTFQRRPNVHIAGD
jgi:hypothetical protein